MLENKKILVTGATGGVAKTISTFLAERNEVWGAARFTNPAAKAELEAAGIKTFRWALGSDEFDGLPVDFDYVVHAAATIYPVKDDFDASIRENAEGSALLMRHVCDARAFLFISSLAVYAATDDKSYRKAEDFQLGQHKRFAPTYSIGKIATEAVVRSLARVYNLPCTIGRLGMNYGIGCPGVVDELIKGVISGKPFTVPPRGLVYCGLVNNSDIIDQLETFLNVAKVSTEIINWIGDEPVEYRDIVDYVSELTGIQPELVEQPTAGPTGGGGDPKKRISITGPCRQDWKAHVRDIIRVDFPQFAKAGVAG